MYFGVLYTPLSFLFRLPGFVWETSMKFYGFMRSGAVSLNRDGDFSCFVISLIVIVVFWTSTSRARTPHGFVNKMEKSSSKNGWIEPWQTSVGLLTNLAHRCSIYPYWDRIIVQSYSIQIQRRQEGHPYSDLNTYGPLILPALMLSNPTGIATV